jgi:hypothetical protein
MFCPNKMTQLQIMNIGVTPMEAIQVRAYAARCRFRSFPQWLCEAERIGGPRSTQSDRGSSCDVAALIEEAHRPLGRRERDLKVSRKEKQCYPGRTYYVRRTY